MAGLDAPEIEISATGDDDWIDIGVRDRGPGIAPEAVQRLFEPFFTTKPLGKGLGLGLYVSYGLAEDIGGRLCASNHPEGGAIFHPLHSPNPRPRCRLTCLPAKS